MHPNGVIMTVTDSDKNHARRKISFPYYGSKVISESNMAIIVLLRKRSYVQGVSGN